MQYINTAYGRGDLALGKVFNELRGLLRGYGYWISCSHEHEHRAVRQLLYKVGGPFWAVALSRKKHNKKNRSILIVYN